MDLKVKYSYVEGFLPSKRHRKLQYRDAEGETTVTINEISKGDAPVTFIVRELLKKKVEYRLWEDKLWTPVMWGNRLSGAKGRYPLKEFLKSLQYQSSYKYHKTKEEAEQEKHDYASRHLLIDGIVYGAASEPRYVVNTFGLGHNHGGTGMFVETYYNSNISRHRYFNALERSKAISEGKRIAKARGDSESVTSIGKYCDIKVLIPEAVHCNPQLEHGDGDPFLNKIEAITEMSPSSGAAAILGLGVLARELR